MAGHAWTHETKGSSVAWHLSFVDISNPNEKLKNDALLPESGDQRILNFDWMRELWPRTCEPKFPQI